MSSTLKLRWRIVSILLLVSLLPLALVGLGSWTVFGGLLVDKTLEQHQRLVQSHAATIDLYFAERLRALQTAAHANSFTKLSQRPELARVFSAFNQSYPDAFVDLGLLDAHGRHVAYVGPYDLEGKNYAQADWFRRVLAKGSYISDVFLGFRQVPHCVIAVLHEKGSQRWILRATINSDSFESLVRAPAGSIAAEVFLVNRRGEYQLPPRGGKVLGQAKVALPPRHEGVRRSRVEKEDQALIQVTTWLNDGRWLLVVQQDADEIRAPVDRAMLWGVLVVLIAVALVALTTFLATWHLTRRIDRATAQRDKLQHHLLRSAKLASLGELATGLAHEINNPLGIISAEGTNIKDQLEDLQLPAAPQEKLFASVERVKRQVRRCGGITAKMLQFGRKTEVSLGPTEVGPPLQETIQLLSRQALVRNIELQLELEPGLPRAVLDANELEQVMVNLVQNAMHAIDGRGVILISARQEGRQVAISVSDTGSGIAATDLEHIFEPFFTTKPVGQGTGLGLSVCYGIVGSWGGTIEVVSEVSQGTVMTIYLAAEQAQRKSRLGEPGERTHGREHGPHPQEDQVAAGR